MEKEARTRVHHVAKRTHTGVSAAGSMPVQVPETSNMTPMHEQVRPARASGGMSNKLLVCAIVIGLIAIAMSSYVIIHPQVKVVTIYKNVSTNSTLPNYNITSVLLEPPTSFSDAPVITQNESYGHRLTDINEPFNASSLAAINDEPDSYFETAATMILNGSIPSCALQKPVPCVSDPSAQIPVFLLNGKPTVIYLGSTTCIFCGENRWAMALALSRFGNFSNLFVGYSSIGDGDVPTVYWAPTHYNVSSTVAGDFYSSPYINFLAIEDANPISGGFDLNTLATIQQRVNQTNNTAYIDAIQYIILSKGFDGTPFTIWGQYEVGGADAVDLGNTTAQVNGLWPITQLSHGQLLSQLSHPQNAFAWGEYAGADMYVAMMCKTLNNTAPVCSMKPIQELENQTGF